MLEQVDFSGNKLSKDQYKQSYKDLIERLVVLQQQAHENGCGLVVLFEGWDGAGKGSRISDLMYNLDARSTSVYVSPDLTDDYYENFPGRKNGVTGFYPLMYEFWESLGERGHITFYDRGWYSKAASLLLHHSPKDPLHPDSERGKYLDSIADFEKQLSDDGYTVVKFFIHVRQKAQLKRLKKLYEDKETRWRVPEKKIHGTKDYKEIYKLYDNMLNSSNFEFAPWVLIDGEDSRRANLQIAHTLVEALTNALEGKLKPKEAIPADVDVNVDTVQYFVQSDAGQLSTSFPIVADYPQVRTMTHTLSISPDDYKRELKSLQKELFRLENLMFQARIPLIIMYEGWDAAGKGGNIKRVAQGLDARSYTIIPSPAPTRPELAHPHLWRYWTRLPKAGHVAMFDRSWYGRVLVERVEGFTPAARWSQGYEEINEFEHDLVNWGAILLKFWVDVSQEEQLARFKARQVDPSKQWKITEEDWRNRDKFELYKQAIDDMFRLTSTTFAPWTVLESDDKKYARIKALRIIVKALKERLNHD